MELQLVGRCIPAPLPYLLRATICTWLRMRVVAEFYGSSVSDYACGPYVYGQAEDYSINVTGTVSAPTVTTPVNYCVGATASALTATGTGLLWYTAATGGTGSATAPTPSTASATTTTYYVSQSTGSCESARTAIVVNVNALPTIGGTLSACVGATSTLTGSATAHATTPWTSSNTAVATVSSTGVVTGVGAGTTTITYSQYKQLYTNCHLHGECITKYQWHIECMCRCYFYTYRFGYSPCHYPLDFF